MKKQYAGEITVLAKQIKQNQREVYEAKEEIEAGTYLTRDLVEQKVVYGSQAAETYINEQDFGKIAIVTIPKGVHVQKHMIRENTIENALREVDYSCIKLGNHVGINDIVDIRIFYPNGENYIVLSKKTVKNYNQDLLECFLWLSEEEIVRMSSAIVDAYLYDGAYLYCTKYIEPEYQNASIVNYQPSLSAQELIKKNENIINVAEDNLNELMRKELESRLVKVINADAVKENMWNASDYGKSEVDENIESDGKSDFEEGVE